MCIAVLGFGFGFFGFSFFAVAGVENLSSSSVAVAQHLALFFLFVVVEDTLALVTSALCQLQTPGALFVSLPLAPALPGTAQFGEILVLLREGRDGKHKTKIIPLSVVILKALKWRPAKDFPQGSWPCCHPASSLLDFLLKLELLVIFVSSL